MTDPKDPADDPADEHPGDPAGDPGAGGEPVGSVGEEAAKLFGALSDWARDQGGAHAGAAAGMAGSFAHAVKDVNDHVATGSQDCRYCPVCQVIHVVRQTSPEVRTHLAVAASSLMHAAAGLLATQAPGGQASNGVEKIDLDSEWDEDQ